MRIDKFLKVSRIIKRRTVANEACSQGRISINQRPAKPSSEVKVGDIIEIQFASNILKIEVLSISEHISKNEAKELYKILS